MTARMRLMALVMIGVVAVAACGGGGDGDSGADTEQTASEETAPQTDSGSDDAESSEKGEDRPSSDASSESGGAPKISEGAISRTEDFIAEERLVKDAHIGVEGEEVQLALIVNAAITEEKAKETLNNAARFLATQVSMDHEQLSSPDAESLGGLWDHYDLQVMAGTSPDDVLVHGAKVTSAREITW